MTTWNDKHLNKTIRKKICGDIRYEDYLIHKDNDRRKRALKIKDKNGNFWSYHLIW